MARQVALDGFAGVVRGVVTRVNPAVAGSYFVQVPRLHGTDELGPYPATATVIAGGALVRADKVVLVPVEGRVDDLIIIGKL